MAEQASAEQARRESLRERTRRAVRNELLDVAQELFARQGYEQVTIEEIAQAAGISRRSFFRYFASKEALVLGKFDRQGEQFVDALNVRPLDEPLWEALRRMVDGAAAYVSDPGQRAAEMERVIHSSETLHARFLHRMESAQHLVTEAARKREASRNSGMSDIAISMTVATAFSALMIAGQHARTHGVPLAHALDEAMTTLTPTRAQ